MSLLSLGLYPREWTVLKYVLAVKFTSVFFWILALVAFLDQCEV